MEEDKQDHCRQTNIAILDLSFLTTLGLIALSANRRTNESK